MANPTLSQITIGSNTYDICDAIVRDSVSSIQDSVSSMVSGVSGVKGNSESSYRTKNVNITLANILGTATLFHTHVTTFTSNTLTKFNSGSSTKSYTLTSITNYKPVALCGLDIVGKGQGGIAVEAYRFVKGQNKIDIDWRNYGSSDLKVSAIDIRALYILSSIIAED